MKPLLLAELIKLRTTRTFYALAGVAIGLSLIFVVLGGILTDPTPDSVMRDVFQVDTSSLFIMILAIVGITGEWRHRTITSSLLAMPDRIRFLAAKTIAFAAAGALLSLAIAVVTGLVGYAILEIRDQVTPGIGELGEQTARNVLVAALLGALGVGIGSLIRNQPTAIVFILVFSFLIDPLLGALLPGVERFSPLGALPNAIGGYAPEDVGMDGVDFLALGPALALMGAWIAALYVAGTALLVRRDVE
jgi:ABC-2 type transport system permease protein